jgi:hypothetical protein
VISLPAFVSLVIVAAVFYFVGHKVGKRAGYIDATLEVLNRLKGDEKK